MTASNGHESPGSLDIGEELQLQMEDGSTQVFEVRAIFEDGATQEQYAVLERSDGEHDVIVTDLVGNLIEDPERVDEVLENYGIFKEEAGDPGDAG